MGAKKIKKRRVDIGVARVNRALRAITAFRALELPPDMAPVPIWELNYPVPGLDEPEAPIPAIRPELVDPVVIITDPHVVTDFEATGMRMASLGDQDLEKMLLLLINGSRPLDARNIDTEFAIDLGPEIRNRTMGKTLADLVKHGRARVVATHDGSKVIVQMIFKPEDAESAAGKYWLEYWDSRKRQ